jgi:predicted solute-binding protein
MVMPVALLIDNTVTTEIISVPLAEEWVETDLPVTVREGLTAADVTSEDVALISVAEATLLADTHVLISDVAVVLDGISPIAMRTPVRPDGVEDTVVRLLDVGPTAEMLARALLRPYFGITATSFATSDSSPGAALAQVVILDGAAGLTQPEAGFHEDLAKHWFVLTGQALVSHVVAVGLHAHVRGAEAEIAVLQEAVRIGQERRKDVRKWAAQRWEIEDRDALAEFTNRQRFSMTPTDRNSLANLVARGTWGSRFGKRLPVYRDLLPDDVSGIETTDESAEE